MNGMLDRLETASTTNRRLVSDASHELRTPIAVIRAELDVARRSTHPDWVLTGKVFDGELERLQGLVDDLLLLAHGDKQASARKPFSIADTVRDIGGQNRHVPVDVAVGADVDPLVGDAGAVGRALDRLSATPPATPAPRSAWPWSARPRSCASTSTTMAQASHWHRRRRQALRATR